MYQVRDKVPKEPWTCRCRRLYKTGYDGKAAASHRGICDFWKQALSPSSTSPTTTLSSAASSTTSSSVSSSTTYATSSSGSSLAVALSSPSPVASSSSASAQDEKELGQDQMANDKGLKLRRSKRSHPLISGYGDDGLDLSKNGDDDSGDDDYGSGDLAFSSNEDDHSDSGDEKYVGMSLKAAIPENMILHPTVPRLGISLVGKQLVFRWDTGWFHGRITHFFNANERKKLSREDRARACNFEVQYTNEVHFHNTPLLRTMYSCSADAPVDSWALCGEAPCGRPSSC